jgi:hypothetical protein
MDQPIEQPIYPQAGITRPQTAQLPASSPLTLRHAGLQDFTKIPSTDIRTYIQGGMVECADLYGKLSRKWSDIYAAACEVERRFEKRPGARNDTNELHVTGWEAFLEECGIKPATFRKWRQRAAAAMKPLESFVDPPKPNGVKLAPRPKGQRSGSMAFDSQAPAAKNLADARKQLGAAAAAGNAQAVAIIAEYEQALTTADSGTVTNESDSTSDRSVAIDPTDSDTEGVRLAEVIQLVKYWASIRIDIRFDWFVDQCVGSSDIRLESFSGRRIATIAKVLGDDATSDAVQQAYAEFAKNIDTSIWNVFLNGTPEERSALQEEIECKRLSGSMLE